MSATNEDPRNQVRQLATGLSQVRQQPCLVLATPSIHACTVRAVRAACLGGHGAIDVVLYGPGGCPCCAYVIARELRRTFDQVTAFVPVEATSAMTLVALAANELVLGPLGRLGPLDLQHSVKQKADSPADKSCLEGFRSLSEIQEFALATFEAAVGQVVRNHGMCADDACRAGNDFVGQLVTPLLTQIDARGLGESVRILEVGQAYADRILRRYRSDLYEARGAAIIEKLVSAYPSHDFVIDLEELADIGVPARLPAEPAEAAIIDALADVLPRLNGDEGLIEVFSGSSDPEAVELQVSADEGRDQADASHACAARACACRRGAH